MQCTVFESRLLCEINADDLRALCQTIKGRGAPATAVHARDIVKQIYAFANLHDEKVPNPADHVTDHSRNFLDLVVEGHELAAVTVDTP